MPQAYEGSGQDRTQREGKLQAGIPVTACNVPEIRFHNATGVQSPKVNPKEFFMMNTVVFALMMQVANTSFIVSTKAGLVNYVQGDSNVKTATGVKPGNIIETGSGGAVEVLLNPGSYLRLGENTQVMLEKAELYDIALRIMSGSAIIEANGFTKDLPLVVDTGNLKMEVIKDGIYLFSDGKVIVVEGKIRDAKNGLIYGKGYQISDDQGYRAQKVKTFTTALELWSQKRDAQIAQANLGIAKSLSQTAGIYAGSFQDVWFWYPAFGSFIYLPGGRYRSPYGYVYQNVSPPYYGGGGGGGYRNGSQGAVAGNSGNTSNTGTVSSSNGGGGGGFSGGGGGGLSPTGAGSAGGIPSSSGATAGHAGPSKSVSP
jgi:hypothetical protein